jgi:hypothetical protein
MSSSLCSGRGDHVVLVSTAAQANRCVNNLQVGRAALAPAKAGGVVHCRLAALFILNYCVTTRTGPLERATRSFMCIMDERARGGGGGMLAAYWAVLHVVLVASSRPAEVSVWHRGSCSGAMLQGKLQRHYASTRHGSGQAARALACGHISMSET